MKWCIVAILCVLPSIGSAQVIRPLEIGDQVPTGRVLLWENGNIKEEEWDVSTDELVILSFWATWCTSCIEGITKLDSLQKTFWKHLKVRLINSTTTNDDVGMAMEYLDRWVKKTNGGFSLQSVLMDDFFNQLFPHYSIPHYVWIYRGRFVALSGRESLNWETVSRLISTGVYTGNQKKRPKRFDEDDKLLHLVGKSEIKPTWAIVSEALDEMPATVRRRFRGAPEYSTWTFLNQELLSIIRHASGFYKQENQIEIIGSHSAKERFTSLMKRVWCYERHDTVSSREVMSLRVIRDLENQFGFKAKIVDKKVSCIVITELPNASGHAPNYDSVKIDSYLFLLNEKSRLPVLLDLPERRSVMVERCFPDSNEDILSFLRKAGFVVRKEKRKLKVLQLLVI